MKKAFSTAMTIIVALALAGCGKPLYHKQNSLLKDEMIAKEFPAGPQVIEVRIRNPIIEDRLNLDALKGEISMTWKKPLSLHEFLTQVFDHLGISAVFNLNEEQTQAAQGQASAPSTAAKRSLEVNIPSYRGSVRDLLRSLMETHGIFFRYENNTLVATTKETFGIHIDNYPDIGKIVANSLKSLGAENVSYDPLSSKVFFMADYRTYKRVREMAQDLKNNLSIISFHMVVGEVKLTNSLNTGIDWENLTLAYASPSSPLRSSSTSSDTTDTTTTGTTSQGINLGSATVGNLTGYVQFSGGATGLNFSGKNFSVASFIHLIERYGKFYTLQAPMLAVANGFKGKLDASTKIPYLDNVGLGVIGSGTTTTNQQTFSFTSESAGVILELLPYYNSYTNILSFSIEGKVQTVESRNVSTPSGVIERPMTSVRNITTHVVMKPDSVVVLGGLRSQSDNFSTTGLPKLANSPLGLNKESSEKSELVIIIKPIITRFVVEG